MKLRKLEDKKAGNSKTEMAKAVADKIKDKSNIKSTVGTGNFSGAVRGPQSFLSLEKKLPQKEVEAATLRDEIRAKAEAKRKEDDEGTEGLRKRKQEIPAAVKLYYQKKKDDALKKELGIK